MTRILDLPRSIEESGRVQRRAAGSRPQPRKFRPDIEGMRAFAVVAVVLYHAKLGVRGGFVGVDVFFVISGFLITRQLLASVAGRGLRGLPDFYTRRIRRLLPAATTVVVATVLVARFYAPALQVRSITLDGLFTTFYGLNYRLAIQGTQYLHQNDAVSPLQHFWSLGVEEQFYVVWPLLIGMIALAGRRFRNALLFVVLVGLTAVSFYFSVTVTAKSASWAYFSLHTRAWELGLGGLVALAAPVLARLPRRLAGLIAWPALAAMVASAFLLSDATRYPGSAAAWPVVAAAALIACGCGTRLGVERRILNEPLLQSVGRVSYSWYLWHWPMLILAPVILGHSLSPLARVCVVWVSLITAIASYCLIENPSRHMARRTWQGFSFGLVLSGSVVTCAALVLAHLPALVGTGAAVRVVQAADTTPAITKQMLNAVAAGVSIQNAPSNLTPTPDKATKDLPPADGTSCHADFLVITQGPCVYGDPAGKHTAVLVGDSHADVWLPAFAQAARAKHWKIVDWTKSSCPAAQLTVFSSVLNRTYTECDTWRTQVIGRIAALKPSAIFMSGSENVVDANISPQQWSSATLTTLNALHNKTKAQVTLIQDVPVPAYDMPSCVAQHLNAVGSCTFSTSKAYSFPARHRQLAADVHNAGFAVVDPESWICTANTCPAVVGNMLVYRDDTHLTATFSRWLAPMVAPLLTAPKGG
jgi:peptidoglycan/LPS O-acetylase OafA/YrhL